MISAKDLMLFYICLNLAIFVVSQMNLLPYSMNPQAPPQTFLDLLNVPDIQYLIAPTVTGIGGLIGIFLGHGLLGGALLVVAALTLIFPPLQFAIIGVPQLIAILGLPDPVSTTLKVLCSFIWFIFIIEYLGGRKVE